MHGSEHVQLQHVYDHNYTKVLQEHVDRAEIDLFNDRVKEIRLGVAMCSVTVLRYMTGAVSRLPISVVTRIGRHHDVISVLVPLLESPPWLRENARQEERREGNQWVVVPPSDRFKLSNIDAQVCMEQPVCLSEHMLFIYCSLWLLLFAGTWLTGA